MAKSGQPRKARAKAPEGETKRAKFLRLGGQRVTKALKAIRLIGNLSGSGYEYTEADIKKIDAALDTEMKAVLNRFQPRKPGEKSEAGFQFGE